jgi:hypothetical protein
MIVDVYDSFLDPAIWPPADEIERLARVYGWEGAHPGPSRALGGE